MSDGPRCTAEGVNPDDWFIDRTGKQYSDDEFLTDAEKRALRRSVLRLAAETYEEHEERVAATIRHAESGRRREALARRRAARAACHECPLRLQCLQQAIDEGHEHGTWGGYFEEDLRKVRREIAARRKR